MEEFDYLSYWFMISVAISGRDLLRKLGRGSMMTLLGAYAQATVHSPQAMASQRRPQRSVVD